MMNTRGKIMRLLGQSAVNTIPCEEIGTSGNRRPIPSHSLAFCAGKEILCLDRSPDGQRIVVAGPRVFKILKVEENAITEEIDLRAVIRIHATSRNTTQTSEINNNLTIVAVKWSHSALENILYAASANGVITAYDLKRVAGDLEIAKVVAHDREIYKISISPHKPQWLLSASRDGTVKSWNLRLPIDNSRDAYFRRLHTFRSTSEVLDVQWSPIDGLAFVCSTELGQIIRWNLQDSSKPNLRINAHFGQCYSVAWHFNGEHIASGGQDQLCHVWSIPRNGKRIQKPLYTIETRAPISHVLWRPALWSATAHAKRAAQITISYQDDRKMDSLVEIWDLARPTMPFKQLPYKPRSVQKIDDTSMQFKDMLESKRFDEGGWDTAPTGILWNSRDILWIINNTIGTTNSGKSTNREGWLIQSNISFVPNSIEQRSLSNLAFSPTGDILMILEQRQAIHQRRPTIASLELSPQIPQSSSPNSYYSLSDSEGDIIVNFLGIRRKKGSQMKISGNSNQVGLTLPGTNLMTEKVMSLEDSITLTGIYKPQQVMAIGHTPSSIDPSEYQYYSSCYLNQLLQNPRADELPNFRITSILDVFTMAAKKIGNNRLAQTWKVLGMSMDVLLTRRAEYHREQRLLRQNITPMVESKIGVSKKKFLGGRIGPVSNGESTLKKSTSQTEVRLGCQEFLNSAKESTSKESRNHQTITSTSTADITSNKEDDHSDIDNFVDSGSLPIPYMNLENFNMASCEVGKVSLSQINHLASISRVKQHRQACHTNLREKINERFVLSNHSDNDQRSLSSQRHNQRNENLDNLRKEIYTLHEKKSLSNEDRSPEMQNDSDLSSSIDSHSKYYSVERQLPETVPEVHDATITHSSLSPSIHIQKDFMSNLDTKKVKGSATHRQSPVLSQAYPEKYSSFITADFIYTPDDPLFTIPALDPTNILRELIIYHTTTTQTPLHLIPMLFLLLPFLSPDTIDFVHANQIISDVHARLYFLEFYIEAAILRNLCVPKYPDTYVESQENVRVGFFCTTCNKPYDSDPRLSNAHWKCHRCKGVMAFCPICERREFIPDELDFLDLTKNKNTTVENLSNERCTSHLGIWWYCPGCAHGGHVECMLNWHAASEPNGEMGTLYSNGICPVVGCLHPCLAGSWRHELVCERAAKKECKFDNISRENVGNTSLPDPIVSNDTLEM